MLPVGEPHLQANNQHTDDYLLTMKSPDYVSVDQKRPPFHVTRHTPRLSTTFKQSAKFPYLDHEQIKINLNELTRSFAYFIHWRPLD
jgi:hypothetical protein